jgi:hypothetical protein
MVGTLTQLAIVIVNIIWVIAIGEIEHRNSPPIQILLIILLLALPITTIILAITGVFS